MKKVFIAILSAICVASMCLLFAACSDAEKKKETEVGLSLIVGQRYQITTNYEYYEQTFNSENAEIATVNKFGEIKAVSAGSTRIIANVGNQYIYYSLTVSPWVPNVLEDESIYTVKLDKTNQRLLNGGSFDLKATVSKNGRVISDEAVEWSVAQDGDILRITTDGNTATVAADAVGKATVMAKVAGYSAACTVTSYSEDIHKLDFEVNVIQGEGISWENIENAESVAVSFDGGLSWENYETSGEIRDFGDEPAAFNVLFKAIGDDCYYETSETKSVLFRTKMNLLYDEGSLTIIPIDSVTKYNLYNNDEMIAENLSAIDFSESELFELAKAYVLNLKAKSLDGTVESNALTVKLNWNYLDFESDCNFDVITANQITEWGKAENSGDVYHINGGEFLLKGTPTGNMATFEFDFGRVLKAGTTLKFSLYVANTDSSVHGWFPIVVNGKNQSYLYAYWSRNDACTAWKSYWAEEIWTLTSMADSLTICCNFGEFCYDTTANTGGTNSSPIDLSKVTVYIDNVMIVEPKTSFGFENTSEIFYITGNQMTGIERVANDGTEIPVHENGGDYLLKGTPTGNMATFSVSFGQTITAGTKIKFSLFVSNADDNVWGWFPIVVNGRNQSSGYAYWVNQGHWSAIWYENEWVLETDSDHLDICCNFGEFYRDGGNNLDLNKLTVFVDNITVVG